MNQRLKVGLFIDTFYPMIDGVVQVVDNYARRLSKDCDVIVFAPTGRKKFDDSTLPYRVVRCTKKIKLFFLDYDLPLPKSDKKFLNELENSTLDIVHIHSPFSMGGVAVRYAKKHNIPCIGHMHSQFKRDFKKNAKLPFIVNILLSKVTKIFNSCDECWAVNEKTADLFVEYGVKKRPKIVYNGTDMLPVKDFGGVKELRLKYNISADEKVFLFVGRMIDLKNIFFILDSLKNLKHTGFKFKMIYVGSGPDEKKLKRKIAQYGLENEVVLTGKVSSRESLANFYAVCDLVLFPSAYDTDGLVRMEGASQSKPTLFIENTFASSAVKDDENGYISKATPKDYANKIIEIFSNEKLYKNICKNAYKDLYILWDDVVKNSFEKYVKIVENFKNDSKK